MSGENTFGRAKLSPEYEAFLKIIRFLKLISDSIRF
jgi:hypothetical protein